jgi:hypothetical protein
MTTDTLIEQLARELRRVEPLPRPGIRTALWVAAAVVYLTLVAAPLTSRGDIAANTAGGLWFVGAQLLAVVTGVVAAAAAFRSVIPGYSRQASAWAAIAACGWATSLAMGARGQWSRPADPELPSEWVCVALIVASGAPMMVALLRMLRNGAAFTPSLTAALSALSVTSLANIGACASHPHTNHAITLVWHGTTLAAAVVAFAAIGPRIFRVRQAAS